MPVQSACPKCFKPVSMDNRRSGERITCPGCLNQLMAVQTPKGLQLALPAATPPPPIRTQPTTVASVATNVATPQKAAATIVSPANVPRTLHPAASASAPAASMARPARAVTSVISASQPSSASKSEGGSVGGYEKKLREAKQILWIIGALTIGINLYSLATLADEVKLALGKSFQATGLPVPDEVLAGIQNAALQFGYALTGVLICLGIVFVVFGFLVHKFPVTVTATALVLYVSSAIVFGVLDPSTLLQGAIVKVLFVAGLLKALTAAIATLKEKTSSSPSNATVDYFSPAGAVLATVLVGTVGVLTTGVVLGVSSMNKIEQIAQGNAAPPTPAPEPEPSSSSAPSTSTATPPPPAATTAATTPPTPLLKTEDIVRQCEPSVCMIRTPHGLGTGFVVGANLICTNEHVIGIANESQIEVEFPSRGRVTFKGVNLAYTIRGVDLVLLSVPGLPADYVPLPVEKLTNLNKGEKLIFIGNPQGLAMVVTEGAFGSVQTLRGEPWLQLSGSVNHGNSGGPALTMRGQVAGIITLRKSDAEGIGFAIPGDTLDKALHDIRTLPADRVRENVVGFKARQTAGKLLVSSKLGISLIDKMLDTFQEAITNGKSPDDQLESKLPRAAREALLSAAKSLANDASNTLKSLERDGLDSRYADILNRLSRHANAIHSQVADMRGTLNNLISQAEALRNKFKGLQSEAETLLGVDSEDINRVVSNVSH